MGVGGWQFNRFGGVMMFKRIMVPALALSLCATASLSAQADKAKAGSPTVEIQKAQKSEKTPHHLGELTRSEEYGFETVYMPDGIRVYTYLPDMKPIPAREFQGRAVLAYKDGSRDSIRFKYIEGDQIGEGNKQVRSHDYLFAPVDLSKADKGSFDATFYIFETAEEEPLIVYTQSYAGLTRAPFVCPMCPDGWGATAESKCGICGMYTSASRPDIRTQLPDAETATAGETHKH
jgi:hypothetical protein